MISVEQTPGNFNKAFGINPISLGGITGFNKYVLRLKKDGDIIADIRQTPNKNFNALYDIQNVLQTYIKPSKIGFENITDIEATFEEWFKYDFEYGIEDINGNYINSGDLTDYLVFGGKKEYYELYVDEDIYSAGVEQGICLTDRLRLQAAGLPFKPTSILNNDEVYTHEVYNGDYYTISFYNNLIKKVKFSFYDNEGTLISVDNLLTDITAPFITVGIGPKNLIIPTFTKYYFIEIFDDLEAERGSYKSHFVEIKELECNDFDPIQFSWLNSYGFRDYYTFRKKNTRRINVERNSYKKSLIDYNAETIDVIQGDRGEKIYSQKIEQSYTAATDYLLDVDSAFLENMIKSPDVRVKLPVKSVAPTPPIPPTTSFIWNLNTNRWINEFRNWNFGNIMTNAFMNFNVMGNEENNDFNFEPVILLTNEYNERTFRTDAFYQIEVEFKLSNNKKSLRG